jgi:hypothetical protein
MALAHARALLSIDSEANEGAIALLRRSKISPNGGTRFAYSPYVLTGSHRWKLDFETAR